MRWRQKIAALNWSPVTWSRAIAESRCPVVGIGLVSQGEQSFSGQFNFRRDHLNARDRGISDTTENLT
jgi:hypothetical protein